MLPFGRRSAAAFAMVRSLPVDKLMDKDHLAGMPSNAGAPRITGLHACASPGTRTPNPLIKSHPDVSGVLNPVTPQEHWGSARAEAAKSACPGTISGPT